MCPTSLTVESTRNLFMTAYPRMVEILQLLGSSSFMITPSEADFKGPLAADIEQYLATDNSTATRPGQAVPPGLGHRRQLVRQPPGAVRTVLRQRPVDTRPRPGSMYPKSEAMERVLDFLRREDGRVDRHDD